MNDKEADRKPWAEATKVILPTFQGGGTHVNLSGVVLAKHAPNKANAIKLMEWLVGEKAQHLYADMNYEYPLLTEVKINPTIAGYGTLKPDSAAARRDREAQEGRREPGRQGGVRQLSRIPRTSAIAADRAPSGAGTAGLVFCIMACATLTITRRALPGAACLDLVRPDRRRVPVAVAALVVIPLANLVRIALSGETDIWADLVAYVIPEALRVTVLLLAGVPRSPRSSASAARGSSPPIGFPAATRCLDAARCRSPSRPISSPTSMSICSTRSGRCRALLRAADRLAADARLLVSEHPLAARRDLRVLRSCSIRMCSSPRARCSRRRAPCLFEVARTLGATRFMLARHVALPLARPALAVGLSLVLMETLNDIGACEYLGVRTLTLSIFTTWLNRSSLPGAAQIACVMLVVDRGADRAGALRPQRDKRFHTAHAPGAAAGADRADRRPACSARAVCALPVAARLPAAGVRPAREAVGDCAAFDPDLVRAALNTDPVRDRATVLALVLGFGAVMAARMTRKPLDRRRADARRRSAMRFPAPCWRWRCSRRWSAIDEGLNARRAACPRGVGLVVAGSGAAIVIAYVVRFLAIATGSAQAGLARISTRVDDAARTLGAEARCDHAADPHSAVAPRARRRRAAGVRRLPEGAARRRCCCARSTSRRSRPTSISSPRAAISRTARSRRC